MALSGRSGGVRSPIVESPAISLPGEDLLQAEGTVSRECRFQDHPSASVEYKGLSRGDVQSLQNAYDFCDTIRIYGIEFEVESKASSRERYNCIYEEGLDLYTFSVSLQGKLKRKVEKLLDLQEIANFPPLPPNPPNATAPSTNTQPPPPRSVTVPINTIAMAARTTYQGPTFNVKITEGGEKRSLDEILRENAPILGGFVRYSKGFAEIKTFQGLRSWSFPADALHQDGSNSEQRPILWENVELTGPFMLSPEAQQQAEQDTLEGSDAGGGGGGQEPPPNERPPRIELIPPVREEVVEQDENPDQPPANSLVLRTLDSNFDMSGPRKTKRTTITIDGTPERTITETWGFAYRKKDIAIYDSEGEPIGIFSANPAQFWRKIEHLEEQYVYKELSLINYDSVVRVPVEEAENVFYSGPTEADGSRYMEINHFRVEEGYEDFITVLSSGRNTVRVSPTGMYLTEINTTGWKLTRYLKEGDKGDTLDPENLYNTAGCYDFFQNPYSAKTLYKLTPTRTIYGDQVGAPFSVRIESGWLENPARAGHSDPLMRILWDGVDEQRRPYLYRRQTNTVIVTPSLDFIEPLTIMVESRQTSSFKVRADPTIEPDNQDPNKVPLITGEESYFLNERTIIRPPAAERTEQDGTIVSAVELKYLEREVNYTAQEAGFAVSAEQIRFRDVVGRPPEAQTRKRQYRVIPADQDPRRPQYTDQMAPQTPTGGAAGATTNTQITRFFVTSPGIEDCSLTENETRDFPNATTPEEALNAAKLELAIANMSTVNCSKTLTQLYPQILDGDLVDCEADLIDGRKIVSSASFSLTFQGKATDIMLPSNCAICEGTQLQLGLWQIQQLDIRRDSRNSTSTDPNDPSTTEENPLGVMDAPQVPGNPQTIVNLGNVSDFEMGGVLRNEAHRRKFTLD